MEEACGGCDKVPGFCELCKQFPKPAEAVQACSGYDQPVTRPFNFITGLVEEVIDVHRTTHLHLFRGGFQRFAQSKCNMDKYAFVVVRIEALYKV
jgi:hypothetical protein